MDYILYWIPFFAPLKLIFLVWCWAPSYRGDLMKKEEKKKISECGRGRIEEERKEERKGV